jgi:hypothetical protein
MASNNSRTPPRGIAPETLLDQLKNTIPFVFELGFAPKASEPHLKFLRQPEIDATNAVQYFKLCLAAHHASVASFVPTDVDNQIRLKLWHPSLSAEVLAQMSDLVTESLQWSFTSVSTRVVKGPESNELLSGHHGEWFSTAVAAYAALRKKDPVRSQEMCDRIINEVKREAALFTELKNAGDGIGLLKASTLIAHNLGDLDRVIEMWELSENDSLRKAVFKAGHKNPTVGGKALIEAGALNKAYMAVENHRHFALRASRCLRRSADLLLPIGPFFDDWGATVAKHPALSPEDIGDVVEKLIDGWERLKAPVGYARAIAGIEREFAGGYTRLSLYVPARLSKTLRAGSLKTLCIVPRARFENQWIQWALKT